MDLHRNKGKWKHTINVYVPGLVTAKIHKIIISNVLTAITQNLYSVSALECNRHNIAFYFPLQAQQFICIYVTSSLAFFKTVYTTMNDYNHGPKYALCNTRTAVSSRYTFGSTVSYWRII